MNWDSFSTKELETLWTAIANAWPHRYHENPTQMRLKESLADELVLRWEKEI